MATRVDHVVLPLPARRRLVLWPGAWWLNDRTRGMYFLNRQAGLGHARSRFRAIAEHWISTTIPMEPGIWLSVSWRELKSASDALLYEPAIKVSWRQRVRAFWGPWSNPWAGDRRYSREEALSEFIRHFGGDS